MKMLAVVMMLGAAMVAGGAEFAFTNLAGVSFSKVVVVATNKDRIVFKRAGEFGYHAEWFTNLPSRVRARFDREWDAGREDSTNGWMALKFDLPNELAEVLTNSPLPVIDRLLEEIPSLSVPGTRLRLVHETICEFVNRMERAERELDFAVGRAEDEIEFRYLLGDSIFLPASVQASRRKIAEEQKQRLRDEVKKAVSPFREMREGLEDRLFQVRILAAEAGTELPPC